MIPVNALSPLVAATLDMKDFIFEYFLGHRAPMLTGVLVGALMGGVSERWELVAYGSDELLGKKVLDGGREAYAELRLKKVE